MINKIKNINQETCVGVAVFLLRVVAGIVFIQNGGLKLFGWFGGMPGGMELSTLIFTAGILEFFGGLAILLGFFTRPVAFTLSGMMAVAYFIGHASQGHFFVPLANQGQPAVLLCFIFLFFAAYGAGKWSIDKKLQK
ncbi:MAG: DoxX family protein [Candidatus Pacebacteria bacterium]|nr:DoxX family protein [Candidatus Paceibacterota bacterium]